MNYLCEGWVENEPCHKEPEFQGSLGHLLCSLCKEALENKNQDVRLKTTALGFEGQTKILNKIINASQKESEPVA